MALSPPSPGWGSLYGVGESSYQTPDGPVWMFRKGQHVRFYDIAGDQIGPEQRNVAPAIAYAISQGWDLRLFEDGWVSEMALTAGQSTCPVCGHEWTVTPVNDCVLPACGCFGHDVSESNPARPCEPCGVLHIQSCSGWRTL